MKIINADGLILGRMSSAIAKQLLNCEEIIVINAEKAIVCGNKKMIFQEYKKIRELTHPRKGPYYPKMPDKMVKRAIRGMIPYQTPRGRKALKNLKVYMGIPKEFQNKDVEIIQEATNEAITQYVQLLEVSRFLGAKL